MKSSGLTRTIGAAAAAAALTLCALPAQALTTDPDGPSYGAPTVGTCSVMTLKQSGLETDRSTIVPCSQKHTAKVAGVVKLPDKVAYSDSFKTLYRVVANRCLPKVNDMLGRTNAVRDSSAYIPIWFEPTKNQRQHGARWVSCSIILAKATKLAPMPTDATPLLPSGKLGKVAARRRLRPRLDLGERAHGVAIGQLRVVASLREPVQAEIARTPLQHRHGHRKLERVAQPRQVAHEELVLQRLGGSAEQRAGAAQQRRHEIRERLADAGARLDDERAALLDRGRDRERHVALHGALGVVGVGGGERARAAERVPDRVLQRRRRLQRSRRRRHAGLSGSSSDSIRVILSRRMSRRFFSRRKVRSSVVASSSARSMRSSRSACSMRSSISRRGRECKSSSMDSSDSRLVRGFGPLAQYQTDYSFWP